MKDDAVLQIIREKPGATGYDIYCALQAEWRKTSRIAKWFGEESVVTEILGPGFGGIYASLWRLEDRKAVRSEWGIATAERGWHRPRHYYAIIG